MMDKKSSDHLGYIHNMIKRELKADYTQGDITINSSKLSERDAQTVLKTQGLVASEDYCLENSPLEEHYYIRFYRKVEKGSKTWPEVLKEMEVKENMEKTTEWLKAINIKFEIIKHNIIKFL